MRVAPYFEIYSLLLSQLPFFPSFVSELLPQTDSRSGGKRCLFKDRRIDSTGKMAT